MLIQEASKHINIRSSREHLVSLAALAMNITIQQRIPHAECVVAIKAHDMAVEYLIRETFGAALRAPRHPVDAGGK